MKFLLWWLGSSLILQCKGRYPQKLSHGRPMVHRTIIVVWVSWEASGDNPSCEPADGRTRMLIHRDPRAMICVARHSHDGNIHRDVPVSCVAKIVFCKRPAHFRDVKHDI